MTPFARPERLSWRALTAAPAAMRIGLYAAALLLAAGLGAAGSQSLMKLSYSSTTAADLDSRISEFSIRHPGAGAMFTALRLHYPEVYRSLTHRAAMAIRNGDLRGAEYAALQTTRSLSKERFAHLAHASPDRLLDWGKSALALMNAAQSEAPKLCADVAFGTVKTWSLSTSPSLANAVGRHAAATIAGFHEGETAAYSYAEPSTADQRAVARAVAAQGLSPTQLQGLGAIDAIRALPEPDQCALGIKLLRGVVSTDEPVRSRILSMMAAQAGGKS